MNPSVFVTANVYVYENNEDNTKTASLILIQQETLSKDITAVVVENTLIRIIIGHKGRNRQSVIGEELDHLADIGYLEQSNKCSDRCDISNVAGTRRMLDILDVTTTNHDIVLELMKVIRKGELASPSIALDAPIPAVELKPYANFGDWS